MPKDNRTRGVNCKRPKSKYIMLKGTNEQKPERIAITSKKKKPLWVLFKDYINSLNENQIFTRGDLFDAIYEERTSLAIRSLETSIDHYRLYACHIGFLDRVETGTYRKLHSIPDNMTVTMMKKWAYNDLTWKDWFIDDKSKLETIQILCDIKKT
jgi:hypothetical protein